MSERYNITELSKNLNFLVRPYFEHIIISCVYNTTLNDLLMLSLCGTDVGGSGYIGLYCSTQASWKYYGSKRSSYSRDFKNS